MSNFTEKEINEIKSIISRYQNVSGELLDYQKQADEIQKKVIELNNQLSEIKKEEDVLMKNLHKKYGDFSLQYIYELLNK